LLATDIHIICQREQIFKIYLQETLVLKIEIIINVTASVFNERKAPCYGEDLKTEIKFG
jgi:hypothetical protein